jgi:O-succinylbenzoic acid--CoA ligase
MIVEAWLTRAAAAQPHRTAVQTPAGNCTYAQLLARASAIAGQLLERGAVAGERVAIALPPGLDFAYALHACLLLGASAVPVDLRMSPGERARVASGAVVVIEEPLDCSSHGVGVGPPVAGGGGSRPARDRDRDARVGGHRLDATALVIHTSGTSAAPRPIELTYGNLLWSALGSAVALGLDPEERWLCALPLSHVGGLSILVRSAIYATTAVVHERFETERVLHALREEGITLVSLVATTLARLLDAGLERPPSLRCALTGGGPVPAALVERARAAGLPVSVTYGLTESCSQVTTAPVAALAEGDFGAGPPLFCTRVRTAEDGEILVAGPTVAPSALAGDGWLYTGDLGAIDERGRLSVFGRKGDTIVSGGENVSPSEVEAVLESYPDVLEAAVVGRPDEEWGEAVTAIVVLRGAGPAPAQMRDAGADRPERASLRAHCAAALAPYKVPKHVVLRAEPLPRTRSGKLLRREL